MGTHAAARRWGTTDMSTGYTSGTLSYGSGDLHGYSSGGIVGPVEPVPSISDPWRGWTNGWWPTVIVVCLLLCLLACCCFCCTVAIRKNDHKDDCVVVKMD